MIRQIASALLLLAASGAANATYSLLPAERHYLDGAEVECVAIGDINGDGRQDLVVVTSNDSSDSEYFDSVLVFFQGSDGTLGTPHKAPYVGAGSTLEEGGDAALALADLDGDGGPEIVAAGDGGISVIQWLPDGSGGGQFASKNFYDPSEENYSFGFGDIAILQANSDPRWEVIAHRPYNLARIFLDQGVHRTRKQLPMHTWLVGFNDIQPGDVDGDGRTDLVMVSGDLYAVMVYYNDGSGDLAEPVMLSRNKEAIAVALGDFYGQDGIDEVVVSGWDDLLDVYHFDSRDEAHLVTQLPNNGTSWVTAMQAADLDGDGWQDLAVAHIGGVGTFLSQDGLGLLPEVLYENDINIDTFTSSDGIAVGDVDGDGCNDVVSAEDNWGFLVRKGTGCAAGPAPLPDFAAQLHPARQYFDFHLANAGTATAPGTSVFLTLEASDASLTLGTLPPECSETCHAVQSHSLTCDYPALSAGESATTRIPFTASALGKKALLTISATVPEAVGGEATTHNNTDHAHVRLMPTTGTPANGIRARATAAAGRARRPANLGTSTGDVRSRLVRSTGE